MDFATLAPAMAEAHNYAEWICHSFRPYLGKRLLEVGVGYDTIRPHCPPLECHWTVDIDPAAVAWAQERDPRGIHLVADILDPHLREKLGAPLPDSVLCANVLEHLAEDGQALANLLSLLAVGGHLLILVPAFPALYGPMDRLAGHLRRYRRRDLQLALAGLPGRVVVLRYFNSLGGVGWWLNRWLRPATLADASVQGQVRLFDRYGVPVSRWLDPFTGNYFGQSLICVVEKMPSP